MSEMPPYRFGGARALVELHELELRRFVVVWKDAHANGVALPASEDPNYASLEHLLVHVVQCAKHYMRWMCESLGLPDPDIRVEPGVEEIVATVDDYVEHVIVGWRSPLKDLTEEASEKPEYASRWGPLYCIDAMLEHAVMHPLRHRHQLERLAR